MYGIGKVGCSLAEERWFEWRDGDRVFTERTTEIEMEMGSPNMKMGFAGDAGIAEVLKWGRV